MRIALRAAVIGLADLLAGTMASRGAPAEPGDGPATALASPERFAGIADPAARSAAIFTELGRVLTHPRCTNCHPAGDRPRQGDGARPHQPPVFRGVDGHGLPALRCASCHGPANFAPAGMPGHPVWHLAPTEMAWEGRSVAAICAQIKDPARNGGRSLQDLVAHIGDDSLVGWAWAPGRGRSPAPGTQKRAKALVEAWIVSGAACP
ncbi:Isoquinoline 1-oxidoreductase subunit [Methylorubrum zatmanii]